MLLGRDGSDRVVADAGEVVMLMVCVSLSIRVARVVEVVWDWLAEGNFTSKPFEMTEGGIENVIVNILIQQLILFCSCSIFPK